MEACRAPPCRPPERRSAPAQYWSSSRAHPASRSLHRCETRVLVWSPLILQACARHPTLRRARQTRTASHAVSSSQPRYSAREKRTKQPVPPVATARPTTAASARPAAAATARPTTATTARSACATSRPAWATTSTVRGCPRQRAGVHAPSKRGCVAAAADAGGVEGKRGSQMGRRCT